MILNKSSIRKFDISNPLNHCTRQLVHVLSYKKDMDAFEKIIGQLLQEEKYWVKHSVRLNLSPEEKRCINKPSTPRPEIDIVAYDVNMETVYLLEVKSYLDSPGVRYDEVAIEEAKQSGLHKLLTAKNYRNVLVAIVKRDWLNQGLIGSKTKFFYYK